MMGAKGKARDASFGLTFQANGIPLFSLSLLSLSSLSLSLLSLSLSLSLPNPIDGDRVPLVCFEGGCGPADTVGGGFLGFFNPVSHFSFSQEPQIFRIRELFIIKATLPGDSQKELAGIVRYVEDLGTGSGKVEFMHFLMPGMTPIARFTYTLVASQPNLLTVKLEMRGISNTPTTTFERVVDASATAASSASEDTGVMASAAAATAAASATIRTTYISGESGGEEESDDESDDSDAMVGVERNV